MNIQTILKKISKATDLNQFVTPGKSETKVWTSPGRVVHEEFDRQAVIGEGVSKMISTRMAVATDIPASGKGPVRLTIQRFGGDDEEAKWTVAMTDGETQVLGKSGTAEQMIALYKRLYAMLTSKPCGALGARWVVGLAAVAVLIYVGLGILGALSSPGPRQTSAGYSQMPPVYGAMAGGQMPPEFRAAAPQFQPPQAQPASVANDSSLTPEEKKDLGARANRIVLSKAGAELLVFSDPNCPYCQRLEASLEEVSKNAKAVVIPVAYKDGSREMVASAFCAKDPAAAWKEMISTGRATGKACDAGLKKVDENNKLFTDLNLSATPTIVTPKGLIVASYATAEQLQKLLSH